MTTLDDQPVGIPAPVPTVLAMTTADGRPRLSIDTRPPKSMDFLWEHQTALARHLVWMLPLAAVLVAAVLVCYMLVGCPGAGVLAGASAFGGLLRRFRPT